MEIPLKSVFNPWFSDRFRFLFPQVAPGGFTAVASRRWDGDFRLASGKDT